MIGVDVYDCVMVINDDTALEKFFTHKATVGTDVAVVAGPLGAGGAVESGLVSALKRRAQIDARADPLFFSNVSPPRNAHPHTATFEVVACMPAFSS